MSRITDVRPGITYDSSSNNYSNNSSKKYEAYDVRPGIVGYREISSPISSLISSVSSLISSVSSPFKSNKSDIIDVSPGITYDPNSSTNQNSSKTYEAYDVRPGIVGYRETQQSTSFFRNMSLFSDSPKNKCKNCNSCFDENNRRSKCIKCEHMDIYCIDCDYICTNCRNIINSGYKPNYSRNYNSDNCRKCGLSHMGEMCKKN